MAFKMKGWAPKGPLTYKGGGEATNMPTSNPAFKIEDPVISGDSGSSYENLNDDVNITGMRIEPGQQTLSLDHDDIHNLQVAVQRGGLDKATKDAFVAAINRGPGKPMVVDPESGELNFQTSTGAITTRSGSSDAMSNLLTTLDRGRGNQKKREEAINMPTMPLETIKPSKIKVNTPEFTPKIQKMNVDQWKKDYMDKGDSAPTGPNITNNRNIEGNKGAKTLSQKRAAAVNKNKLSSYTKAWESNKGGIQSKYKNKAEFVKAAEAWWAKKGLDK